MVTRTVTELADIFQQFAIPGKLVDVQLYGSGHIHDTYLGIYQEQGQRTRYIHQQINQHVFQQPEKVMENIERVTLHGRKQILAAGGDPLRETLTLVPTRDGASFIRTPHDEYWRTYIFIPGAQSVEVSQTIAQVYHAAKAFGNYQKMLNTLPGPRLHETIPNFHHTRKRLETFQLILKNDPVNRAQAVQTEIEFILKREQDAAVVVNLLAQGALPERATHNDTKLNNVLIDDQTGAGICVIDLDTTMPGTVLYDFGDLIRMGTATAAEDEPDLSKVSINLRLFEELAHGYLDAARDFLTPLEWEYLVFGGRLITYEQAIRFLGDYLNGDRYYKIHRPEHNLDRARTQIRMLQEMERLRADMEAIVAKYR